MSAPLVTVIIPTHQRVPMLKVAVNSVIKQTFADFECLVISDHPPEHSLVEAELSDLGDPRIRFLPSNKPGANASRNIGVAAARGRIVAYLDDDDEWLPEKLDRHVLAHQEADLVFSKVIYRYHGRIPFDLIPALDPHLENAAERMERFAFCPPSSTCVSVRTRRARENLWDESLGSYQDWDTWFRILSAGASVGYVSEPMAVFTQHRLTRTSKGFRKRLAALEYLSKKYSGILRDDVVRKRKRLEFSRNAWGLVESEGIFGFFGTWLRHRSQLGFDPNLWYSLAKECLCNRTSSYRYAWMKNAIKCGFGMQRPRIRKLINREIT